MTNRTNTGSEPQTSPDPDGGNVAVVLHAEIEFWRELIATCPDSQSSECVERMHQALALAESRLASLH